MPARQGRLPRTRRAEIPQSAPRRQAPPLHRRRHRPEPPVHVHSPESPHRRSPGLDLARRPGGGTRRRRHPPHLTANDTRIGQTCPTCPTGLTHSTFNIQNSKFRTTLSTRLPAAISPEISTSTTASRIAHTSISSGLLTAPRNSIALSDRASSAIVRDTTRIAPLILRERNSAPARYTFMPARYHSSAGISHLSR